MRKRFTLPTTTVLAAGALLVTVALPARVPLLPADKDHDPLPSWNDGESKARRCCSTPRSAATPVSG
jgi:hypothetical protein